MPQEIIATYVCNQWLQHIHRGHFYLPAQLPTFHQAEESQLLYRRGDLEPHTINFVGTDTSNSGAM